MEVILKRPDGSRVKIIVRLDLDLYRCKKPEYKFTVFACKKGKRTWFASFDSNNYRYRKLSMDERVVFQNESMYSMVTHTELVEAATKLWMSLKP